MFQSGAIRIADDEMLFLQPLANHLYNEDESSSNQRPHLVVKRTVKEFNHLKQQVFEEEGLFTNLICYID